MTSPAVRKLAVDLATLSRKVNERMSPQLANSSLEDGYVNEYDRSGQVTSRLGTQYDGTHGAYSLAGPTPPTPMEPTVTAEPGALKIVWNGLFADDIFTVAPMDFSRVEIHVGTSTVGDFGLLWPTLKGSFESARGGEFIVHGLSAFASYYVCLTTRSESGKPSIPSVIVGPISPTLLPPEDIDVDFEAFGGTTVFYGPLEPTTTKADLWLQPTTTPVGEPQRYIIHRYSPIDDEWQELTDQGSVDALLAAEAAQAAAEMRAQLFAQAAAPTGLGLTDKAIWIETDNGSKSYTWDGDSWEPRLIGNAAVQPNSLVASNVIVTGTITAALLETIMVLTNQVIAGDPLGAHARLTPTGLRVFRANPDGGAPEEVVRMGTEDDDYFAIVDSLGQLVASIDELGRATFSAANIDGDLVIRGRQFQDYITEANQPTGSYRVVLPTTAPPSGYGPIAFRVGMAEVNGWLIAGHRYQLTWQCHWTAEVTDGEADFGLHVRSSTTDSAPAPLASDPSLENWIWNCPAANRWTQASGTTYYTATVTGRHRFLLSLARGIFLGSGYNVYGISDNRFPLSIDFKDQGPAKPYTGQLSQGSGVFTGGSAPAPPPTPTQQYDTGQMAPAGWRTFKGNGTERFDTAGPVQGWDPSGSNGDGGGFWYWNLPSITGTVDYVQVYLFSSHWYYNSGGTARISMIPNGVGSNYTTSKFGNLDVGGFQKPGGMWIDLGGSRGVDWRSNFRNVGAFDFPRAVGISVGPSGGTNLAYYGKFDGPGARLRIIYTQ